MVCEAFCAQEPMMFPFVVRTAPDPSPFASGRESLVVVCSYSGETQEALSALEAASRNECSILALCSGGALEI